MQILKSLINNVLKANAAVVNRKGIQNPENQDMQQIYACLIDESMQDEITDISDDTILALIAKLSTYVKTGILASTYSGSAQSSGAIANAMCSTLISLKFLEKVNLPKKSVGRSIFESLFSFYKKQMILHCHENKIVLKLCTMTDQINKIVQINLPSEQAIQIIALNFLETYFKSTTVLQTECMHLIRTIINKYPNERLTFMNEFRNCLSDLHVNCFRKDDNVHIFTKLFLYLVESLTMIDWKKAGKIKEISKKVLLYRDTFEVVWTQITTFIHDFFSACDPSMLNYAKTQQVFKRFISDLLSVALDPKWFVSSLVLSNVFGFFAKHIKSGSNSVANKLFIIECLQLIAPIFGYFRESVDVVELCANVQKIFPKYTQQLEWLDYKKPQHAKLLLQKFFLDYNEVELNLREQNNFYLAIWIEEYYLRSSPKNLKQIRFLLEKPDRNKSDLFMEINVEEKDIRQQIYTAVFFINADNIYNEFVSIIGISDVAPSFRPQLTSFLKEVSLANPAHLTNPTISQFVATLLYQKTKNAHCIRDILLTMFSDLITDAKAVRDMYVHYLFDTMYDSSLNICKKSLHMFAMLSDCMEYEEANLMPVRMIRRFDGCENTVTTTLINIFHTKYFATSDRDTFMALTNFVDRCNDTELRKFEVMLKLMTSSEGNKVQNPSNNIDNVIKAITYRVKELCDANDEGTQIEITRFLKVLELLSRCVPQFFTNSIEALLIVIEQINVPKEHIVKYVNIVLVVMKSRVKHNLKFLLASEKQLLSLARNNQGVVQESMTLIHYIVKNHSRNFRGIKDYFRISYQYIINDRNESEDNFDLNLKIVAEILSNFSIQDLKIKIITDETFDEKVVDVFKKYLHRQAAFEGLTHIAVQYRDILLQPDIVKSYQDILENKMQYEKVTTILECILRVMEIEETSRNPPSLDYTYKTSNGHVSVNGFIKKSNCITILGDCIKDYSRDMTILKTFLQHLITSYQTRKLENRHLTIKILHFVVILGLDNYRQIVPHLLVLSTDFADHIHFEAIDILDSIHSRQPNILARTAKKAVKNVFTFQRLIMNYDKFTYIFGTNICQKRFRVKAMNSYIFDNLKTSAKRRFLSNILEEFTGTSEESYIQYILYLADNIAHFNYTLKEDILLLLKKISDILVYQRKLAIDPIKQKLLEPNDHLILTEDFVSIPTEMFIVLKSELAWIYGAYLLNALNLYFETNYNITKSMVAQYCKDIAEKNSLKLEEVFIAKFEILQNKIVVNSLAYFKHLGKLSGAMKKQIIADVTEVFKIYDTEIQMNQVNSESENIKTTYKQKRKMTVSLQSNKKLKLSQ